MKKLIFISLLVLGTLVKLQAQQIPLYSQYYYNPFLYNPAMAGYNSYSNVFLIDRMQWTGVPGAPVTRAFTMDGPVKDNKIGLGLNIYDDQTGIFDHLGAYGAYSYNIRFAEANELRLGLSGGIVNNTIDYSKVQVKDPNDNALLNTYENRTSFDANFGISYHNKDLLLGFAIPQLLAPRLTYMENSNMIVYYSLVRHFIGSAKYTIHLSDDKWKLEPMAFAQYASGAPVLLDAGVNVKYKDLIWLGVLWRKDFAVSTSIGMKLNSRIIVGYAYDWMTSAISPYAGGTHEIMLGYTFGKAAAEAHDNATEKSLKELNDRAAKEHLNNKATQDSLARELNKANKKIEMQDSIINSNRHSFDDFKRDMLDSIGKLHSGMHNSNYYPAKSSNDMPAHTTTNNNEASYVLNDINFPEENAVLAPSSYGQLDELAATLKKNPKTKIEIDGFCDYRGTDAYNMTLSVNRANAVKNYLEKAGVKPGQLATKGFGKTRPIADNATPEGMAKNRRVEIKILHK